MAKYRGDYMRTFTGRKFYPMDPQSRDICIDDIAHSLSQICRFGGQVKVFYSVGEHLWRASFVGPPEEAKWRLMHDAAESYYGDMVRPLKHSPGMELYRQKEHECMRIIAKKFKLKPIDEPLSVKQADNIMLLTEQRDLMKDGIMSNINVIPLAKKIIPMKSKKVEKLFLKRFYELS